MNRQEYLNSHSYSAYRYKVIKLLKDWKIKNNITEACVIHHRDDTEECRKYNEEHYELWGFEIDENSNPQFEYGKYVIFMTNSAHTKYHHIGKHLSDETKEKISIANKGKYISDETRVKLSIVHTGRHITADRSGEKAPFYGKHHSEEAKAKMSAARIGKKHSEGTKAKMSEARKGENNPNYGKQLSEETREKISQSLSGENHPNYGKHLPDETKNKISENMNTVKFLYNIYKNNSGIKKWNDFQKALKTGDKL